MHKNKKTLVFKVKYSSSTQVCSLISSATWNVVPTPIPMFSFLCLNYGIWNHILLGLGTSILTNSVYFIPHRHFKVDGGDIQFFSSNLLFSLLCFLRILKFIYVHICFFSLSPFLFTIFLLSFSHVFTLTFSLSFFALPQPSPFSSPVLLFQRWLSPGKVIFFFPWNGQLFFSYLSLDQ